MDDLLRPEPGWLWVHPPLQGELVGVICGEIRCYETHWYRPAGGKVPRAVRCVRREVGECDWCTARYERRVRYVVPLLLESGVRLVELSRTVYTLLSMIREGGGEVGRRITIARERPFKNAPLVVVPGGRMHVGEEQVVDIRDYVMGLGREALALCDRPPALTQGPPER
jgi:hypothetical protein